MSPDTNQSNLSLFIKESYQKTEFPLGKTLFESMTKNENEIKEPQLIPNATTSAASMVPPPAQNQQENTTPQQAVTVPTGQNLVPYIPNFDHPDADTYLDLLKILADVEKANEALPMQTMSTPTITPFKHNNNTVMKNSPKTSGLFTKCHIGSVHFHFNKNSTVNIVKISKQFIKLMKNSKKVPISM